MVYDICEKNTKTNKNTRLQSAMVVSRAGNLITDNCYGSLTKAGSETGKRVLFVLQQDSLFSRKLLPVPVHEVDHI